MKKTVLLYLTLIIFIVFLFSIENPLFVDSGQNLGGPTSHGSDSGDLDGDGDFDVFVSNHSDVSNEVWFNDGTGHFTDSGQSLGNSSSYNVKLKDLDGDGDLDAFVTNYYNQPNKVWLNNGSGFFTDSGQNLGNSSSLEVALEDLDGDGDIDAFVANYPFHPNKVWFNNGNGYFTDSGQNLGNSKSHGVALEDLDGDGDFDAFVANSGYPPCPNKVWLNNSSGFFTDSGQSLGTLPSKDVCLKDLNNDGYVDAFVSNVDAPNKVWFNDGNGYFTDSGQNLGYYGSYCTELGDVEGDGDIDAFVVNFPSQPNRVWLNNGLGIFSDSGLLLGNYNSLWVVLNNFNGDNYLDAYVSNASYSDKVWLNQTVCCIEVDIDIKPGSDTNSINLGSNGNVPVAIFSSDTFDATNVNPLTVTLAGASVKLKGKGIPMYSFEDVNVDGFVDMILHFKTKELQLSEGDTEAILEGETYNDQKIKGVDTVRIVPEK